MSKRADRNLVRRVNIALILNRLRDSSPQTRAMLAASTGLTRATVSSLIEELITLKLVRESGIQDSQVGRPGICLELDSAGGSTIGIEISSGFVAVILADFVADILWRKSVEIDTQDFKATLTLTENLIEQAAEQSSQRGLRLLGIGLGLPGLIKSNEGILLFAPNLGWHNIPFQEMWEKRFGIPVQVLNDASAAALGEYYFGLGADYADFVYLRASAIGLGAGIMIDRKLFQGVAGYAGEFGHMVIDPSGPLCTCGRHGCWERLANSRAIIGYVIDQTGGDPKNLTLDMVIQAFRDGDPVAYEAVARASRVFSIGITNIINIFNPQLVIIGGALGRDLEPFLPDIEQSSHQAFQGLTRDVEIRISQQGDDDCVMGTIAAVQDNIFTDPARSVERLGA